MNTRAFGRLLLLGLFAFLAGMGCGVLAQGYPERPVRLIVPQAAGSATDTVRAFSPPNCRTISGSPWSSRTSRAAR